MRSGRFAFVRGANEREELLAVFVDLHRANAADLAERERRLRATHGDLEERAIGEHHVRGHLLVARDARAERAQALEQLRVGGRRDELRDFLRTVAAARSATASLLFAGLWCGRDSCATRSVVRAEAVVAATAVLPGGRIAEVAQHEAATAAG